MSRPDVDLRRVDDAQVRLEVAIARLDDRDVRRASSLPGWTVGHVLTHLARNADSHRDPSRGGGARDGRRPVRGRIRRAERLTSTAARAVLRASW